MARVLAMFPGQGSQYVGMGKDLLEQFPLAKSTFEEAEDSSKIHIRRLCLEGPEDELRLTANTQPCILTVSVAMQRILKAETGLEPAFYAGHSLGEYSAVVAAEKLEFARAALLVRKRGEAMQAAVPAGVGAMAAVMNLDAEVLNQRCQAISSAQNLVQVVNYNSPQQLVVAGHKAAVETLVTKLEAENVKSVILPVSAPFHSSLMTKAREAMQPLLLDSNLRDTPQQVLANLTGKIAKPYTVDYLIKQIDSPVLWLQTMQTASEQGCDTYLEIGPGKVLFGLARRCLPKGAKLLVSEDIRKAIADVTALV